MIGVFDSGLGGLTALRVLASAMPLEQFVYFGDTGRVPYGTRSPECIRTYAREDLRFLLSFAPRAILVACGTVSAVALEQLRGGCPVPLFGVAESGAAEALRVTKNRRIGITGTTATVNSGVYERLLTRRDGSVFCRSVACPLLVPLIESGLSEAESIADPLCRRYLSPFEADKIDTLILGCTHYPLLRDRIGRLLPHVHLVDVGAAGAHSLAESLGGKGADPDCPEVQRIRCYVSDDPRVFQAEAVRFFGCSLSAERVRLTP